MQGLEVRGGCSCGAGDVCDVYLGELVVRLDGFLDFGANVVKCSLEVFGAANYYLEVLEVMKCHPEFPEMAFSVRYLIRRT